MGAATLFSLGLTAVEHPETLEAIFSGVKRGLLGDQMSVAVLGQSGSGKTSLVEHLTGRAPDHYVEHGPSRIAEQSVKQYSQYRFSVKYTVVPGLRTPSRVEAIKRLFHANKRSAPDGILYVASNGLGSIREDRAQVLPDAMKPPTSVSSFREYFKARELLDLAALAEHVAISAHNWQRPRWMMIVANKADLYADDVPAVREYYTLGEHSPFAEQLSDLQAAVGQNNLAITTAFCSSQNKTLLVNTESGIVEVPSKLDSSQVRTLLSATEMSILRAGVTLRQ